MDGIDAILQAEKEAERIRRDAHVEADALLGSAEGYRQRTLDAARLEGINKVIESVTTGQKNGLLLMMILPGNRQQADAWGYQAFH